MKEEGEGKKCLLEELFDDIIAEGIEDDSEAVAGTDNMTAILIDLKTPSSHN